MSAADPSDFLRNPPSVVVKVQNTSQESINGQLGIVVQYTADRGRYLVHMAHTQQTVALKPENLVKGNFIDQAKAQYLLLTKDPRVRQEIQKYYSLVQSKLPPGVKPEHAGAALVLVLLITMYLFGFTRILMLISMLMMIGLLIGPDVFAGGRVNFNWRLIATNFPMRCRNLIEQNVPMLQGKITDKVAAGIIVFLLLISARTIFLPMAPRSAAPPMPASSTSTSTPYSRISVADAYKLGFDDATQAKDFGSSLPSSSTASTTSLAEDPLLYDNLPPLQMTRKPWYSKLGMWQMMSLMNIGRTLWEMGRDPSTGTFSAPLAMANLQQAPPMKLGLLGFSVYNLLKVFF